MKKIFVFLLKVIVIFLLAYYVFKDFEFTLFFDEIARYSLIQLSMVVAALFITDLIMSLRWVIISGDKIRASLEAVMVSATMNILLPARIGEVAKAVYLKRYYSKSFNRTLSLIIFERFFDILFLATGALYVLYALVDNPSYRPLFFGVVLVQLLLLLLMKYYNAPILFIAKLIPIRYLRIYAKKIILTITRKVNNSTLLYTIGITFVVWMMNFFVTFVFLNFATDFHLSFVQIFVVFIITGVGFALPLLPAGALTFQASYVFALGLYGVSQSEALAASMVFHIIYIITMLLPGKIILLFKQKQSH